LKTERQGFLVPPKPCSGWNDQLIAARNSINYYQSVVKAQGAVEKTADSIRLFMVPGMAHCGGGDGTSTRDMQPQFLLQVLALIMPAACG
jgi:hypothetical protein